jgi:hypothetical protein
MGNYARLKVTQPPSAEKTTLLEGKNHLPEGWALFFSAADLAETGRLPMLEAKVSDAIAVATQRRALLVDLCDRRLLDAVDGFIALVQKQPADSRLTLDPDELEVSRQELLEVAGLFSASDPKHLKAALGKVEGLDGKRKLKLDEPYLVFGDSPSEELEWLEEPVPPMPASLLAAVTRFFKALGLEPPASRYSRYSRKWSWDAELGARWFSLSGTGSESMRFTLREYPAAERAATVPVVGMTLAADCEEERLAWWGAQLAARPDALKLPSQYILAWHACEGADVLVPSWTPTARERAVFLKGLQQRLGEALRVVPNRIGLGDSSVELRRVPPAGQVPEHVALRLASGRGDESWITPKTSEMMPPSVQRAEARSFIRAGLSSGLNVTVDGGPTVTFFEAGVKQPLPFIYWLNNTPQMRKYALYLMDLPDDAARQSALKRDA